MLEASGERHTQAVPFLIANVCLFQLESCSWSLSGNILLAKRVVPHVYSLNHQMGLPASHGMGIHNL